MRAPASRPLHAPGLRPGRPGERYPSPLARTGGLATEGLVGLPRRLERAGGWRREEDSSAERTPSRSALLRTAFLLLLLVSATWLLGLLAVNSDVLAFHYLFAAFSCVQVGIAVAWAAVGSTVQGEGEASYRVPPPGRRPGPCLPLPGWPGPLGPQEGWPLWSHQVLPAGERTWRGPEAWMLTAAPPPGPLCPAVPLRAQQGGSEAPASPACWEEAAPGRLGHHEGHTADGRHPGAWSRLAPPQGTVAACVPDLMPPEKRRLNSQGKMRARAAGTPDPEAVAPGTQGLDPRLGPA